MATQVGSDQFDVDDRFARLREIINNAEKLQLEGQKLAFERNKLDAERLKLDGERLKMEAERVKLETESSKLVRDRELAPWLLLAQGLIGGAALLGGVLALLKYLTG